jgi:hypothetical protein
MTRSRSLWRTSIEISTSILPAPSPLRNKPPSASHNCLIPRQEHSSTLEMQRIPLSSRHYSTWASASRRLRTSFSLLLLHTKTEASSALSIPLRDLPRGETDNYRFYYGDERKADGSPAFKVDGEAHGKLYVELAEGKVQGHWQQTFVKGVGYKHFPAV